jgi:hypothetical protein
LGEGLQAKHTTGSYREDPRYGKHSPQEDIDKNIYSTKESGVKTSPKDMDKEGQVG